MPGLIIDNFAGGGGASTGIERALGRAVDIAINHDPEAVAMHAANHPGTRHFCQSIMAIDPLEATGGAPVDFVWFSPDCKHHSKAKGGKPREKHIRDLAHVVPHWAERLAKTTPGDRGKPKLLFLENVEEFRQWGPLDAAGMPIKARAGEEFRLWVRRLRRLGYKVEYRELRACDYGAPTSRKRLYLVARCDGRAIAWPAPTHGKRGSAQVLSGRLLPWRSAAECIDWSIACPSIFDRKRPLKEATLRRIAHGVMRYVVDAAEPFVVRVAHGDDGRHRTHLATEPLGTQPASNEFAVVDAGIVPITHTQNSPRSHATGDPARTITTANGGEFALSTATLAAVPPSPQRGAQPQVRPPDEPEGGCAGRGEGACLAPHVTKFRSNSIGSPADAPMPTVTANGASARPAGATPLGLAAASMVQLGYGERPGQAPRALDVADPLGTVVAGGGKHGAVTAFLSSFYTSNSNGGRGLPALPLKTILAGANHHAVVCAHMEQANTGLVGHAMREAVSTIVGKGCTQRLVETTLVEADALPPPLMERAVAVAAFLIKYYGNEADGHGFAQPLGTVTTKDRFAVVTVTIDAQLYVIVDIGMRMLTRRELANAQGFPADYILDPIGPNGKPLTNSASIRMIGNSVCPDMAEALIRANLPELCTGAAKERAA